MFKLLLYYVICGRYKTNSNLTVLLYTKVLTTFNITLYYFLIIG